MRRKYTKEDYEFLRKLGHRIRELREQTDLSQAALEIDSKMSKNQIGRIERGEISTSVANLNLMAKALQVDIQSFFDFEE
ncbi:helix-turn-helix domain-containing protein [Flagellimonas flava]|uniref:Helix-turn-helix domain-containing protein n=1 Tax=Flagellimonas flava TaxID=570519 RepID=A0A1M5LNT8_9FLAO|nr:helix-turn-helix transcriptional regulator [Allomuricauda flava]SHG66013.1 Helix-turn-helix domain-containing protein [Allomuricauda flava]